MPGDTVTAIAFVDTETTGLGVDDEVWEFACVRVDADGQHQTVIHIEHDDERVRDLPPQFREDRNVRWGNAGHIYSRAAAGGIVHAALDGAHIIGVNPTFDAMMLTRLLVHAELKPSWHYHLIDVAAATLGYLAAEGEPIPIPWRSDDLSARVGVPTKDADGHARYDRHTALGDITWTRDWWDALQALIDPTERIPAS